jgi:hypothetical protein
VANFLCEPIAEKQAISLLVLFLSVRTNSRKASDFLIGPLSALQSRLTSSCISPADKLTIMYNIVGQTGVGSSDVNIADDIPRK